MTALREAVAKLLCKLYDGKPDDILGHDDFTGPIYRWHGHRGSASQLLAAVFAALREPTEKMCTAAARADYNGSPIWVYLADAKLDVRFADAIFRAMLAEAERAAADGKGE